MIVLIFGILMNVNLITGMHDVQMSNGIPAHCDVNVSKGEEYHVYIHTCNEVGTEINKQIAKELNK